MNAGIVASVVGNVLKYSPKAVILMISNPMDTMTYLALKKSGLPKNQIFGMGGALDSARFKCYLSKALKANSNEIEGMVIGGHGDTTMIPLYSKATYKGIPVTELLSKEEVEKVVADTMVGGATLTKLLGTSDWYAPGAAAAYVVESIIRDQKKVVPSCTYLEGEYGQNDICIGVPAVIGRGGVEKVLTLNLTADEKALFEKSMRGRSQDQQHPARIKAPPGRRIGIKVGRGISLRPLLFFCKGRISSHLWGAGVPCLVPEWILRERRSGYVSENRLGRGTGGGTGMFRGTVLCRGKKMLRSRKRWGRGARAGVRRRESLTERERGCPAQDRPATCGR